MDINNILAARRRGDRQQALSMLQTALLGPAQAEFNVLRLADLAASFGEVSLARAFLKNVLNSAGCTSQTALVAAGILAQMGQLDDARTVIEPRADRDISDPALQHFMGTLLSQFGDHDKAAQRFHRTLKAWPMAGAAWLSLAALKTFTPQDADLNKMQSLEASIPTTPAANQSAFYYALGKAYVDIAAYEKAAITYNKGAVVAQRLRPYSPQADDQLVVDLASRFTSDFFSEMQVFSGGQETQGPRPIFVVGLPRSGSTLVEQILTSHSKVQDGGELNLFREAAYAVKGFSTEAIAAHAHNSTKAGELPWQNIAKLYQHLITERFGTAGIIVDKTLGNSRLLGLIRLVFPDAPIIWMRRDPYDTAWSCFRTHFNQSLDWTWGMADIARHFTGEDALYKHWTALWPDHILTVPYSELVENPEEWIHRILQHAGLGPEPAVSNFHQTKRAVVTSSMAQVREPVNRKGMGVAGPFKPYMGKFTNLYKG